MYDPQQHTLPNWVRLLYPQLVALYYSEDHTLIPLDMRLEASSHAFCPMIKARNYFTSASLVWVRDRCILPFPASLHPLPMSNFSQGQLLLQNLAFLWTWCSVFYRPFPTFPPIKPFLFIWYPTQMSPFPGVSWGKALSLHSYWDIYTFNHLVHGFVAQLSLRTITWDRWVPRFHLLGSIPICRAC